jgi:hypothetical protein
VASARDVKDVPARLAAMFVRFVKEAYGRIGDELAAVEFPTERSLGEVCWRRSGRRRWRKLCQAQGVVELPAGMEYCLKVSGNFMAPGEVPMRLKGISLDSFAEVQLTFLWFRIDYADSLCSGDGFWPHIEQSALVQTQELLHTKAKIVVKLKPFGRLGQVT